MYCKNCGNPFEGRFCPNCGAPAEQSQTPSAPVPPVEQSERVSQPITKRWWFWLLAALTIVVIVLSLTNKKDKDTKTAVEATSPTESTAAEKQAGETEDSSSLLGIGSAVMEAAEEAEPSSGKNETPVGDVAVNEQVVLDEQGLKITVLSLDMENWFGPTLNLLIENNTEKNLTVQARNTSVNGVMMDPYFSCDVAAGKKANSDLSFISSDFSDAGITTLQTVELLFYVYETDTWDDVFSSGMISIQTTAPASFQQTFDDAGTEVLSDRGIRFVVQRLDNDPVWGSNVRVYVENNSDRSITVQLTDVSVNGFMIDPYYYSALLPGKVAFDRITFSQTDFDDNHISSIETLEFRIHIYDTDSWDTVADSGVISLNFK
ncbi:MAG: zinc ribbon domain-containing protein [Clostridiaceae bacterium]